MNLDGYITVAERLSRALEKWPELLVTEAPPRIITIGDSIYIEVTTIIYRSRPRRLSGRYRETPSGTHPENGRVLQKTVCRAWQESRRGRPTRLRRLQACH